MTTHRTRLTVIIGSLVLIVLAAIAWFAVLSPRLSQASELSTSADQLNSANLSLTNNYNRTLALAHKAPAAAQEAQALFSRMPQQADLPRVIDQINAAAAKAGIAPVNVQEISTGVPAPIGAQAPLGVITAAPTTTNNSGVQIATMAVNIRAQGPPAQMLTFVDNLAALDRALLITGTQLTSTTGETTKGQQLLTFDGTMFVLQSQLPDLVATVNDLIKQAGQGSALATGPTTATGTVPVTPSGAAAGSPAVGSSASAVPSPGTSSAPLPLTPAP